MPTCPRCALLAVALAALTFAGCDSNNPGADLALIEGTYAVSELYFRPSGTDITPIDVAAALDASVTRLEIFGDGDPAQLVSKLNSGVTTRTDISVAASRGRASFRAVTSTDAEELAQLLLPTQFSLTYDERVPGRLTATLTDLRANLEAFDPARYQGATSIPGQLTIRLTRQ